MAEAYLQVDEYAASRLGQTIACAVEGGITEALRAAVQAPTRDQLAAMAMQGLCSDPDGLPGVDAKDYPSRVAKLSHQIADAMLAERARRAASTPAADPNAS